MLTADEMKSDFGHYLLPLLPQAAEGEKPGGKPVLIAIRDAIKIVERIQGALRMAEYAEIAVMPAIPDFFTPGKDLAKARTELWQLMHASSAIMWTILTRHPQNVAKLLPPDWLGKGYPNVCVGLQVASIENLDVSLQALRSVPVRHKMLQLGSSCDLSGWQGSFAGIDWVVFSGNGNQQQQASVIRDQCGETRTAFLFHQPGNGHHSVIDGGSDPAHPFGSKVRLDRPPMPDILKMVERIHTSLSLPHPPTLTPEERRDEETCLSKSIPDSGELVTEAGAKVMQPEFVEFEVVRDVAVPNSEQEVPPMPELTTCDSSTDGADFKRLDNIVRTAFRQFQTAGRALSEIRDRELWKAGGHVSWAAYCSAVAGLSKIHANRLIRAAYIASHLAEVEPIGFTPVAESQIRPLCRLERPEQYAKAWSLGVQRTGGQPTAKVLKEIVTELMKETNMEATKKQPPKSGKKAIVAQFIVKLRAAVHASIQPSEIEAMLAGLEYDLGLSTAR